MYCLFHFVFAVKQKSALKIKKKKTSCFKEILKDETNEKIKK
jgi:hypothetical protein